MNNDLTPTVETTNKLPVGRPTLYSMDLGNKICEELILGNSLRTVCKEENMPSFQTVFTWLRKYPDFLEHYTRATQERSESMVEDILDIADDGTNDWMEVNKRTVVDNEAVQRSKLRVDTRKWIMSKMIPKKYGDKVDLTTNGKDLPTPIYGGEPSFKIHDQEV